jgi:hypothetical protein
LSVRPPAVRIVAPLAGAALPTSVAARLNGVRVGPRVRRVVLRLPRTPRVGLLAVPIVIRAFGGVIRTELSVVRA